MAASAEFLKNNEEDGDYNQYWYSPKTIEQMVLDMVNQSQCSDSSYCIAFLSTPSLYFSLPVEIRDTSYVFDYDKKWNNDRGFVFYDFNKPDENIPATLLNNCDMVVIDPPFITREVWEKYSITANLLLKKGHNSIINEPNGKIIGTTVYENKDMLMELLNTKQNVFMPSIPNLVYQYNLYTNYNSVVFNKKNPEIPE